MVKRQKTNSRSTSPNLGSRSRTPSCRTGATPKSPGPWMDTFNNFSFQAAAQKLNQSPTFANREIIKIDA